MSMANAFLRGSLFAFGLAGVLFALAAQAGAEATYVIDGSKAAQLDSCVEPTDFMRRNHMEVIKHQRDETVHNGIRSTKHSLAGCIECHVSQDADNQPVPVNAEGQFCIACHEFAAVGMNCFGCHASVPAYPEEQPAGQAAAGGLGWHSSFAMSVPRIEGLEPSGSQEGDRP
jgi:hypothetical protein